LKAAKPMRSLASSTLREMEHDLRRTLRAHHLSESFVERHVEDALQKGVVEYLRAREAGKEVREPKGFVMKAAFRRAIDELRREARRAEGAEVERLLDRTGQTYPSAEEIAVEDMTAADLRSAIDTLPAEERQALCLHYFEELTDARSAELLYCSERTFRRRLDKALADLAALLGAPAPEPGSHRGLEIGLVAWASLGGGRAVISSSPLDHLSAVLDGLHSLPGRVLGRLRGTGTSVAASDAPERIGAIAAGPAGKVIGGCAGAAVICALSGVVGPGVELGGTPRTGDTGRHGVAHAPVAHRRVVSRRPLVVDPTVSPPENSEPTHAESTTPSSEATNPAPRHKQKSEPGSPKKSRRQATATHEPPSEEERVEEQFSGISQAAAESEAKAESPPPTTSGETSISQAAPAPTTTTSEPDHVASEERRVEEQIRGPLAR
jgi:RNA polymerase sigma factor (sigma-70 family)